MGQKQDTYDSSSYLVNSSRKSNIEVAESLIVRPDQGPRCVDPLGKYLSIIIKTLNQHSYNIPMHPNKNKEKSGAKKSPDQ